jgi:hypothetical protein
MAHRTLESFSMNRFKFLVLMLCVSCGLLSSCAGVTPLPGESNAKEISLRFIGETTMPHRLEFQGTTFGGISGIDYDPKREVYYLLSDDRSDVSAARFYVAKIALSDTAIQKPELITAVALKKPDGSTFGNAITDRKNVPDPESIRYRADRDTLLWTSEGDKKLLINPTLREMKLDGTWVRDIPTLAMFEMKPGERGPRDNTVFEGMTIAPDGKTVWVSMEGPLFEDGALPSPDSGGGPIRFTQYDVASGEALRQIAYQADANPHRPIPPTSAADNGVPEVLLVDAHRMLVLERSFSRGVGNSLRVYLIDTRDGTDVRNVLPLRSDNHTAARKKLIINFDSLNLKKLDNTEGMTFGPRLANGNRTLIFVSDDNFSARQITQFLAFEMIEK